jgi:hypothetical protein
LDTSVKVCFLDIDGVLHTRRSEFAQWNCHALDREAVGLINLLVSHADEDVPVVIMSTWRYNCTEEFIHDHLYRHGFGGYFHEDWATPLIGLDESKGLEVNVWLRDHNKVEQFVIIDDLAKLLPEQIEFSVRPNYDDGLLWADFKRAFRILHGVEYIHT